MRITEGIVIDHLPPWSAPELMELLDLRHRASRVCVFLNEDGDHLAKKDTLVVENFAPNLADFQMIALLAPEACVTLVEQGAKARKVCPTLGPLIEKIVKCSNAQCITRAEEVPHKIKVTTSADPLPFQCYYCQTRFSHKELEFAR